MIHVIYQEGEPLIYIGLPMLNQIFFDRWVACNQGVYEKFYGIYGITNNILLVNFWYLLKKIDL
jgi:hypothetical protein